LDSSVREATFLIKMKLLTVLKIEGRRN
jgi:hypothetical protein